MYAIYLHFINKFAERVRTRVTTADNTAIPYITTSYVSIIPNSWIISNATHDQTGLTRILLGLTHIWLIFKHVVSHFGPEPVVRVAIWGRGALWLREIGSRCGCFRFGGILIRDARDVSRGRLALLSRFAWRIRGRWERRGKKPKLARGANS